MRNVYAACRVQKWRTRNLAKAGRFGKIERLVKEQDIENQFYHPITLFATFIFLLFERIVRCVSYSAFANTLAVIYTIDVYNLLDLHIDKSYAAALLSLDAVN